MIRRAIRSMRIPLILLLASAWAVILCSSKGETTVDRLKEMMVKKQIEARGVTDPRVLEAMRTVDRHKFVPDQHITAAYEDHPLPIGYAQTISQPYIVALMSELCELGGTEKVLEIGTGSGYQTAVLAALAAEVYSIEIVEPLGKAAAARLSAMGCGNVRTRIGDGYLGWPEAAPFDVIILTASPPVMPQSLVDQLAEGGTIVAPVGDLNQELVTMKKQGGSVTQRTVTYVRFVPMVRGK